MRNDEGVFCEKFLDVCLRQKKKKVAHDEPDGIVELSKFRQTRKERANKG